MSIHVLAPLSQYLIKLLLTLLVAALCSACSTAHYAINEPLRAHAIESQGYAMRNLRSDTNSDSLVIVLALSGGGYRAAALAHAVLSALAETAITWEGRESSMLDEVDIISSVSGGSLAAAYFALDRESFLRDFPDRVLALDLQSLLLKRVVSPSGLWRQTSSTFGRSDLLQEVPDEQIFGGQRFSQVPRIRPMVYINATDMRHGQRFEFTQDQFDYLCSDLDALPISRAVAASMAVPVLLSPATVWNYRTECQVPRLLRPLSGKAASSRYVHLVDGGLADNTGLNAVLDHVAASGGIRGVEKESRLQGVRKRVIIAVNAAVTPHEPELDSPNTPSLMRQLLSIVNVPIDRHADAKVQNLIEAVRQWQSELRAAQVPGIESSADGGSTFHIVELNLARASNVELAHQLQSIPTGLRINAVQVNHIQRFVREELATNPQWRQLLVELTDRRASSGWSKAAD